MNLKKTVSASALLLLSTFSATTGALDQELIAEQVANLDWQVEAGTYRIIGTDTFVILADGDFLVRGEDARKFVEITEGYDGFHPDAAIYRENNSGQFSITLHRFIEYGFTKMDDWDEFVDKDELLRTIQKETESENRKRAQGHPHLYIDGWIQEPFLNRGNAIVYWATHGHTENGTPIINADAIKLSRKGFGQLKWVGDPELFIDAAQALKQSLDSYEFDDGARYEDFVPGVDTVAATGVGALAYKLITGKKASKVAGAGLLALLVAFAKKLWFLIFIPFVLIFRKIGNRK